LLCANHHGLTLKKKPDERPAIAIEDINDLQKSGFANAEKRGFYFSIPQTFSVSLGNNLCIGCPYVLIVNDKPLIEIWPQRTAYYVEEPKFYLYMRFFDDENNFIGGMFANHWASVVNEEWKLDILENEITASHVKRPIFVKFERDKYLVRITGRFYFDGIEITAKYDSLLLMKTVFSGNMAKNCEVAFIVKGNRKLASLAFCGRLSTKFKHSKF
jgi:hypothetical protein